MLSLIKKFFKKQSVAPVTEVSAEVSAEEVTENKVIEATEIDSTEPKSYRQIDIIEHVKKTKPKQI